MRCPLSPLLLLSACWLDGATVDDKIAAVRRDDTDAPPVDTDTPPSEDTDDTDDTEPPVDDTDVAPVDTDLPLPTCADVRRPPPTPWIASGTTEEDDDDITPTCAGGTPAPDRVYAWRAPAAGCYRFSTQGSFYDTVLVLASDCDTQLMCNDDLGGSLQSEIHWRMDADDEVLIAVDGYGGESSAGSFSLTVDRGTALPVDVDAGTDLGLVASGNNQFQDETIDASSCLGIDSGNDVLIRWTAPRSAFYTFSTNFGSFDATLSAFHECGGLPFECVDEFDILGEETLELAMEAGETIIVRLAGVYRTVLSDYAAGPWELWVEEL